ncbi:MAG: YggS family pyridoxal phosphate-dependent enzyme [Alphaproteobacteria bacterium]|nr:MAG: YggS family pyridoxal phosphate-dependent enzyme [Alphaproteobacteria bacterium]PZO41389.1 MAG: YggS family pyridoxal phosphate-dependent enzyme [Alphaproteobacteria bacterium]
MTPSSPASADTSISERFALVRADIEAAALAAERDPAGVTLVAVSKTQEPDAIDAALATGQRVFGENRVQEAQGRWGPRRAGLPHLQLRLIGPLQSNKAEDAVALFDVIETLDRAKMARALADAIQKTGRDPTVLIQVNTGAEPQKAGVLVPDVASLLALARHEYGLRVEGLMAIPPVDEAAAPHFRRLFQIAANEGLSVLSMGMSNDYAAAIAEGATHVRVGSALFGERKALPGPL